MIAHDLFDLILFDLIHHSQRGTDKYLVSNTEMSQSVNEGVPTAGRRYQGRPHTTVVKNHCAMQKDMVKHWELTW